MFRQTYNDGQNVYSVYLMHLYVNNNKLNVHDIPLNKFKHMIDWKIWGDWTDQNSSEQWSIKDVMHDPKKYKRDYRNILKADLKYPILTAQTPMETYIIIDGNHRLAKSIMLGKQSIKSIVFTDYKLFRKFKIGKQVSATWRKINAMTKHELNVLYKQRFSQ